MGATKLALHTGRVLKGERPADMPVEQITRIGLTLNLKTAKVLGIDFSTGLPARGDEVIEQASLSGSRQPETDDRIRVAAASSQLADILGESRGF
jgi:hypothetical protein